LVAGRWREQLALAAAAAVVGMMLTLGFRLQTAHGPTLQSQRWEQLAVMLAQVERERDDLRLEIAALREAIGEPVDEAGELIRLAQELRQLRLVSGFAAGSGPGLAVILDDSQRVGQGGENPNLFLLHDDDILRVVNELAAAGAEAISINGQRHIATTEIRCAGPAISINNTRVAPPIQIHAIGDPATLESSLRMRGGVLEILAAIGIQVRMERSDLLEVPAFAGQMATRFLRAAR
jgi:uncharacterized protein YlxW (UPF0749 family)